MRCLINTQGLSRVCKPGLLNDCVTTCKGTIQETHFVFEIETWSCLERMGISRLRSIQVSALGCSRRKLGDFVGWWADICHSFHVQRVGEGKGDHQIRKMRHRVTFRVQWGLETPKTRPQACQAPKTSIMIRARFRRWGHSDGGQTTAWTQKPSAVRLNLCLATNLRINII